MASPDLSTSSGIEIFFSNAHEDRALAVKLWKHLSSLKREGLIGEWHGHDILAGAEWRNEIEHRLNSARVILLLVSADFLASDFCHKAHLAPALERHDRNEARVIPIILRPCDWEKAEFARLQPLPAGGKAVTIWANEDEAFASIAEGIRKVVTPSESAKEGPRVVLREEAADPDAASPSPLSTAGDTSLAATQCLDRRVGDGGTIPGIPDEDRFDHPRKPAEGVGQDSGAGLHRPSRIARASLLDPTFRLLFVAALLSSVAALACWWAWQAERVSREVKATAIASDAVAKKSAEQVKALSRTVASLRLASASSLKRKRRLDLSLLLAIEAVRFENNFESRDSLFKALHDRSALQAFLHIEEGLTDVAISPDGQFLAAGFARVLFGGGGVVLYDLASRTRLTKTPLPVPEGDVFSVGFSPDSKTLAAGYQSKLMGGGAGVVLWELPSRKRVLDGAFKIKGWHGDRLAFSRDGKILAVGFHADDRAGVELWDTRSSSRIGEVRLPPPAREIRSLTFSPDATVLAAGWGDESRGGVALWKMPSREMIADAPLAVPEGPASSLAFSPDGKTLAAGLGGGSPGVVLWDTHSRKRIQDLPLAVPEGPVSSVAFSPDGKALAAGYTGQDSTGGVVRWSTLSRQRLAGAPLRVREGPLRKLAFSPDGKVVLTAFDFGGGRGGGVLLWETAAIELEAVRPAPADPRSGGLIAFCPGGRLMAQEVPVLGPGGGVVIWDVVKREKLVATPLLVGEGRITSLAFSPDGKSLAAGFGGFASYDGGGDFGGVVIWETTSFKRILDKSIHVKEGNLTSLAFSPGGEWLVTGFAGRASGDNGVILWGTAANKRLTEDPLGVPEGRVAALAVRKGGATMVAGLSLGVTHGGALVFWDVASRRRVPDQLVQVPEGRVTGLAMSPDGKLLASAQDPGVRGYGSYVVLWDIETRARLTVVPMPVPEGEINSLAFSGDGRALAAGLTTHENRGGSIVWEVATRKRLIENPFEVPGGAVSGVAFGPDGKSLVAGLSHAGLEVVDIDLQSWICRAHEIANRDLTAKERRQFIPDGE